MSTPPSSSAAASNRVVGVAASDVVFGVIVFGVVFASVFVVACDLRPTLAQTGFFDGYRDDLVKQCCDCLSRRGTDDPGATCSEARLVDGGFVVDDDAEFGDPTADGLDDLDDDLDPGEVPCLCSGDQKSCVERLERGPGPDAGDALVIPGACIDQATETAPCENACLGVLNFDPVPTE